MCRRGGLKVNAGKKVVMLMNGEVHIDGIPLENVSEFKYLECVFYKPCTYWAEGCRKEVSGSWVAGDIRFLVNGRDLQLKYAKVLHETLFELVLMYDNETVIEGGGEI